MKKLLVAVLALLATLPLISAQRGYPAQRGGQMAGNVVDQSAQDIETTFMTLPNKAVYVDTLINTPTTDDFSPFQKISVLQNLLKAIEIDILREGGGWYSYFVGSQNKDQLSILGTEKNKVIKAIARLEWQAKHWAYRATYNTGVVAGSYLLLMTAIWASQKAWPNSAFSAEQIKNGSQYSFNDVGWAPLLGFAKGLNITFETLKPLTAKALDYGQWGMNILANILFKATAKVPTLKNIGSSELESFLTTVER